MVVLHDAVEDDVGDGGVADPRVPVFDRQLAGDDGGLVAGVVVDNLWQSRVRHAVDGTQARQQVGLGQLQ